MNTAKGGEVGCQVFAGACKSEQNKILQVAPIPWEGQRCLMKAEKEWQYRRTVYGGRKPVYVGAYDL